MDESRQMVLRMLREGKVSVEEAEALLDALGAEGHDDPGAEGPRGAGAPEPAHVRLGEGPSDRPRGFGPWPSIGSEIGETLRETVRSARQHARASLR